ncbi:MAG: hypothetical protein Q9227_000344 [Pyrenula ochraceoflavens]
MAPAVQLSFTLRTSSNVQTVHLLGSWDNYSNQLPLSIDRSSSKSGAWKGTFRFSGSTLELGERYWYYYIVDGYHVSHDPAKEYTTEPTTGRKLNILDMPDAKGKTSSSQHKRQSSQNVPTGRALSPGKIQHPRPSKPYASRQLREADYSRSPTDELSERFAGTRISDYRYSPPSSIGSDTSFSDDSYGDSERSSPSSLSSLSDHSCRCERYGITRRGDRVKLDCGGARCGYADSSSNCSSSQSEESSESEGEKRRREKRYREAAYKEVSYSKAGRRR